MKECTCGIGSLYGPCLVHLEPLVNEEPKLPEWVETLVQAEKDKAYQKGYHEGYNFAWQQAVKALERANYT